ncbi:MAG TPA: lipid A biosynthesis acyltransferase [Anaeromyxobacteraceae bacterium]|nr:lipid A biosynthesis acyltransferase [Anaeromyxobacteraceae bacterium]
MAEPSPKRLRRALRSALIRGAVRLASLLPLGVALALGDLLGRVGWAVAGKTRRLALSHLALALPELPEAERRALARASFLHVARAVAEAVTVRRIDPQLEAYVAIAGDGERLLREARAAGKGLVLVTGHLGNWELFARRFVRVTGPSATIARPSWDPKIDAMVADFRRSGGVTTLWRGHVSTGRALLKAFRQGVPVGFLIDQDTGVEGVFVPFFGRLAWTARGPADLALRFRSPVFVAWTRRRGPRRGDGYLLEVEPVAYDPDPADQEAEVLALTARCTARLEAAIRRTPGEWVWMHERWKRRPAGEEHASSVPKTRELSAG